MTNLESNNPSLKTWVNIPKNSDFPIQNLPFGVFRKEEKGPRVGVRIGDEVIDLSVLYKKGFLDNCGLPKKNVFKSSSLNSFLETGKMVARNVRERVSILLRTDEETIQRNIGLRRKLMTPVSEVQMLLPVDCGDYTDFYSSEQHAFNVGTMFRGPENALMPNWKHLPVAYHGRSSSIMVSGQPIYRPKGQAKAPDTEKPHFGATKRLDFELEMAFVTCGQTMIGDSISVDDAENYIFGFALFNDWSARDIQAWEYVPLGPFLGKNFGSTISPWIITMDALEPFRCPGYKQDPEVLDYLKIEGDRNFDVNLSVEISAEGFKNHEVCQSNFKYMYWNVDQQLAHHTVNGCNINSGDIYASGTISGPEAHQFGSMLELAWRGEKPLPMPDGTTRVFINDGDEVTMKGYCETDGVRIGFGEVVSKVLPTK